MARGIDEIDDVIANFGLHMDFVDKAAAGKHGGEVGHRPRLDVRRGLRHPIENGAFLFDRGVSNEKLEEEAIELGFGQSVSALLLDRVLQWRELRRARAKRRSHRR